MKIKYYIIHCSDTPDGQYFDKYDIINWHTLPKPRGNGWSRPGYNKLILLDGTEQLLIPYDADGVVEWNEVANGARGFNNVSIHTCYIGGKGGDTRTPEQIEALKCDILNAIELFPDILIGGHYNFSKSKTCPNFDVEQFCKDIGVPDKNIIPHAKRYV